MRKLLLSLTLLLIALLSPPSSKAQFIVVGQACGASGLNGISTNGTPVVCTGNPLVWTAVGGGSSTSTNTFGTSGIQAAAAKYGAKFDAKWVPDAVFNSTSVVTSATAHFLTAAIVGQKVWGLNDTQGLNAAIILPIGTISSIDSDTQIHASTTATASQTGMLIWGTDDGAALSSFWADVTNNANGQTCGVLPSGNAIVSQSEFSTNTSALRRYANCLYSTGFFTVIVSPSMNWATCPTATSGCFWNDSGQQAVQQPNADYIANVEVWGGGYNWATLASTNSIFSFSRTTVSNVWAWGIGANSGSGLTGMAFTGPVQVFEAVVNAVNTACSVTGIGGNQTVALYASFCGGVTGQNLVVGGLTVSIGSQYGPNNSGSGVTNNGARFTSIGDVFLAGGGFTVTTTSGGVTYLSGSEVDNTGAGATALLIQAGGTVISAGETKLNASGGGGANAILQQTTGVFKTDGNTIITAGATNIAPTCAMTTGGGTGPACALVAGSTNEKGTVRMTPGTTPGNSGTTTITYAGTFAGTTATTPSCAFTLANTGTGTWNARATTIFSTRSTTVPVFAWDNNAVALTAASTYDVDYLCGAR